MTAQHAGVRSSSGGFRQFDEEFDLGYPGEPTTTYVVCATQRSGSHFLGHLMYSTGALGYPLEYMYPPHFERWRAMAKAESASDVVRYIQRRRTSPNGCFGMKLHFSILESAISAYPFDRRFPNCKYILLERDDLLGQAISLVRASQSGRWISLHEHEAPATYDYEAILRAMHFVIAQRASWRRFLAVKGLDFHLVRYEDLDADPSLELQKIADFIGVGEVRIDWSRVLPDRQSDSDTAAWKRRFRDDATRTDQASWLTPLLLAGVDTFEL